MGIYFPRNVITTTKHIVVVEAIKYMGKYVTICLILACEKQSICAKIAVLCSSRRNRPVYIKTSSRVPRPGFEPTASGFLIGRHRLKGPDQLDWSIMHPIYLYTLHFASRTTTFLQSTIKHLYQMFRNYFIYSQAIFDSVDTASPLCSDGNQPGTKHQL